MQTSLSARAESEHLAPPLAARIERLTGSDGAHSTAIAGLTLYRFSRGWGNRFTVFISRRCA